jgi:hypothetical protein
MTVVVAFVIAIVIAALLITLSGDYSGNLGEFINTTFQDSGGVSPSSNW